MSWSTIIESVRETENRISSNGSIAWYRGHHKWSYKLQTTLQRHIDRITAGWRKGLSKDDYVQLSKEIEKELFRRFKADAWPLLDPVARSPWGVLFAMQHYGLPTRLLDWTESFACAVFFARWKGPPAEPATVWILDPQELNMKSISMRGMVALDESIGTSNTDSTLWHPQFISEKPLSTIAATPIFINRRMTAQRAAFTVGGDTPLPLEREFYDLAESKALIRIDIATSDFPEVDRFLKQAGITPFTYFPDLEGLAYRYEWDTQRQVEVYRSFYPDQFNSGSGGA